jgi:hypothetical protein
MDNMEKLFLSESILVHLQRHTFNSLFGMFVYIINRSGGPGKLI